MSRSKKSRKSGAPDNAPIIVTRNRTQADVEGRLRKRLNKRKGLKTGNRHSAGKDKFDSAGQPRNKDPRHGSKKPIPLVVDAKATPKLSAEQELQALQNDGQLNVLLDRLDNGEKLGAGLQAYVDEKLDRLEQLMEELGIEPDWDDEFENDEEYQADEHDVSIGSASSDKLKSKQEVKSQKPAKSRNEDESDDDLLSKFDESNLDDWK